MNEDNPFARALFETYSKASMRVIDHMRDAGWTDEMIEDSFSNKEKRIILSGMENEMNDRDGEQIPEELKEGYRIYKQWADARAKAGEPLPPGGVFILDKHAVLKDELLNLRSRIVRELDLKPEDVDVDLEVENGHIVPKVGIKNQDLTVEAENGDSNIPPETDSCLRKCCDIFRANLKDRVDNLDGREDFRQFEVEDLLNKDVNNARSEPKIQT